MSDCVLAGTYADFKVVKTRSVVQMVIEVPIEQANEVTEKFGIPQPSQEVWVAVAKLEGRPNHLENKLIESKEKTPEQKAVSWAVMLCKEPEFWKFLNNKFANSGMIFIEEESQCADKLKDFLEIGSRSEIATNEDARNKFRELAREYGNWKQQ